MDPESDNEMDLALAHLAAEGEGHRLSVLNPSLDDQFDLRQLAVCVRIRPPITAGAPRWDSENCIHATSRHGLAIAPPPGSAAYAAGDRGQTYAFSAVFDEHTSQADYYAATTDALVRDCLSDPAHSSLIMAYGITAAGKTFTLEGSRRAPGLEDAEGRVFVAGLSQAEAASAEHALCLLRRGARQRARAETGLNYASSRSHSVFQITLYPPARLGEPARNDPGERLGTMSFVDLAGSERAQRTGNVGLRLKESVAINSSLMTLGRCLEALRWNQQHREGPLRVLPYRESKVTHLFRDALHGWGQVVLSVNVSPCAKDYDETTHVLRYAATASQIGTLRAVDAPRRVVKAVTPAVVARAKRKAALPAEARGAGKKRDKGDPEAALQAADAQAAGKGAQAASHIAKPRPTTSPLEDERAPASPLSDRVQSALENGTPLSADQQGEWATPGSGAEEEEVGALRAHVDLLLKELKDAEERAARMEFEVRAEVAAEMGALMEEMERNYSARLAAEAGRGAEAGPRSGDAGAGLSAQLADACSTAAGLRAKLAEACAALEETRPELAEARAELEAREMELEGCRAELHDARDQLSQKAEQLSSAEAALASERSRFRAELVAAEASLGAVQAELAEESAAREALQRQLAEESAAQERRRQEELEQAGVNRAMEVEMLEAQVQRARREQAALTVRLEGALSALASLGSPTRPLAATLAAAGAGGGQERGPGGTPHDEAAVGASGSPGPATQETVGTGGQGAARQTPEQAPARPVPGSGALRPSRPSTAEEAAAAGAAVQEGRAQRRRTMARKKRGPRAGARGAASPRESERGPPAVTPAAEGSSQVQGSAREALEAREEPAEATDKIDETTNQAADPGDGAPASAAGPSGRGTGRDAAPPAAPGEGRAARRGRRQTRAAVLAAPRPPEEEEVPEELAAQGSSPRPAEQAGRGRRKGRQGVTFALDVDLEAAEANSAPAAAARGKVAAPTSPAKRRGRKRLLPPQPLDAELAEALGDWGGGAKAPSSMHGSRTQAVAAAEPSRRLTRRFVAAQQLHGR
ncbi:Kinesin-like protein KIF19 [Auxenochlorella protothecoides]|uniref:Kinesin-like protein KIF19 n=1 Tax=Auxenochlorella protothecoides TaxID=3075 RepID=A0A087SLD3_AUXPR|nr:Kinesin-like protein KIF19 [Auxenochlorella protothecoides]KFM26537.1 Kinesin-like protein KIF19 [Auxenochlorella protothecoides]